MPGLSWRNVLKEYLNALMNYRAEINYINAKSIVIRTGNQGLPQSADDSAGSLLH